MNLKLKWHLKEAARYLLSIPFTLTAALLALIAIRVMQFHSMGLGMYPDLVVPKQFPINWALDQFWEQSLLPLLPLFFFTLPIDSLMRRFAWKLGEQ